MRDLDDGVRVVAGLAFGGEDDRRGLVRFEDRDFFGDVIGGRAFEARCTHQDQRFGRKVDVLLVLRGVAGHRLVTELGELDSHLFGSDLVRSVADDRPVSLGRRQTAGRVRDDVTSFERGAHRVGQGAERGEQLCPAAGIAQAGGLRDRTGEERTRCDLGVEGLGGGNAHLYVTTVGCVHHAIGLVGEIRVAPVDDADDLAAT